MKVEPFIFAKKRKGECKMIIVFKPGASEEELEKMRKMVEEKGLKVTVTVGESQTIFGLVGDTRALNPDQLQLSPVVEKVMKVQEPYKKASRSFHPEDSVVEVRGQKIGGGNFAVVAGPCAVESEEQFMTIARAVKESGANFLRGGAFKPRTSPYSFQGMGKEGIRIMQMAREETGLPIITEMMSPKQIEKHSGDVDVIQIGARNMKNFDLLKEAGKVKTPVLLKRGLCATFEEFLMAAEYIMAGGNENVILCERGIRTFETWTRNTLDISAVPVIKNKSHLPIIIDPSHAGGIYWLVEPLSRAAVAIGADGITVEVHHKPEEAMSDGQQSLIPETFDKMMKKLNILRKVVKDLDQE